MNASKISILNNGFEDVYGERYMRLVFSARNETFSGRMVFSCEISKLRELGGALTRFPNKVPDSYLWENQTDVGASYPNEHISLRAYTVEGFGYSALQVEIDTGCPEPEDGRCRFSIGPTEPAALNRLGKLLVEFTKMQHRELIWTPFPRQNKLIKLKPWWKKSSE